METLMRDLDSANSRLSSGAQDFIVHTAIRSPRKLDYKDLYLKLLTSPNRRQMSLGLTCFQEIPAPEAIPRLLELTLDKEANIASRTGLALRHYPTNMEVMRALITLTRNPDAHVRSQTMISMDRFDCPEVTTALLERLKDPDATVRAMVPRAFHYKSAETRAILSPKLLELLNDDPSPQVKASMIKAAGDDLPVARLFGYLQQKDLDTEMRVAVLGSLYVRFSHAPDTRLSAIREHEDLLVAQVMRTEHHMIGFNALCILSLTDSPKIREIISKAAREHRNDYVRQHAQYLAKKQQDALPPK